MVKKADIPKVVIAAALDLAAEKGWRRVSLHDIADRAAVPLADLFDRFASREAILAAFARGIDREVVAGLDPEDATGCARDRLFAVLMRRFDALAPYRDGIAAIARDVPFDPPAMACGLLRYMCSMAWMLEAAGISTAGVHGIMRVKGLVVLYLAVLKVWLEDDSPDKARTMAALDKWLRRAEWIETRCLYPPGTVWRAPESEAEAGGAAGPAAGPMAGPMAGEDEGTPAPA